MCGRRNWRWGLYLSRTSRYKLITQPLIDCWPHLLLDTGQCLNEPDGGPRAMQGTCLLYRHCQITARPGLIIKPVHLSLSSATETSRVYYLASCQFRYHLNTSQQVQQYPDHWDRLQDWTMKQKSVMINLLIANLEQCHFHHQHTTLGQKSSPHHDKPPGQIRRIPTTYLVGLRRQGDGDQVTNIFILETRRILHWGY